MRQLHHCFAIAMHHSNYNDSMRIRFIWEQSALQPWIAALILGDTIRRIPRSSLDLPAGAANRDFLYRVTQRCNVRKQTPDPSATTRSSRACSGCVSSRVIRRALVSMHRREASYSWLSELRLDLFCCTSEGDRT